MKLFERIEDWLQKHDRYDWARKLQLFESHFVSSEEQRKWINKQNNEMVKAFRLLQREIYLKEELSALTKLQRANSLTEDEEKKLWEWEEELKTFDERFWLLERVIYKGFLAKPKGPLVRAWKIARNDCFYYSEEAKFKCKVNGGCCGYDCGCCQRPLKTTRDARGVSRAHCTMECGCCIRRRGFYKPRDFKE
jgi:hypothetical protein